LTREGALRLTDHVAREAGEQWRLVQQRSLRCAR
jgi:hypothetical protein